MDLELGFLPCPGVGHLISTVELAKLLVVKENFSATIFIMQYPNQSQTTSYIQSVAAAANPKIRFVDLPPTDFRFDENQRTETSISPFIDSHKPHVKVAISSSSTRIAALIIDLFSTTMIDVAKELGIPAYLYFTSNAALLGLMLYLPTLHVKVPCEFKDFQGEVEVPGMLPLPPMVMPSPVTDKKDDAYSWFVYNGRRFRETNGLIVNTFAELEPTTLKAITDGLCLPDHHPTPPVYPVGPVLALEDKQHPQQAAQLMEWLNKKPNSSVVFLCFGSKGSFSDQQIKEIALGLERSRHHFLWALRCRSSKGLPIDADLNEVLPDGFLGRTREQGIVWPTWAPQVAILAHPAVGGFVSHCGWNSSLESIWFGVPILAWPLYAEQRLNAFELVQEFGLAVELSIDFRGNGLVGAEELERGVRCLMGDTEKGMKVRRKAKEMQEASRKAVGGGSSFSALELLAEQFMKGVAVG